MAAVRRLKTHSSTSLVWVKNLGTIVQQSVRHITNDTNSNKTSRLMFKNIKLKLGLADLNFLFDWLIRLYFQINNQQNFIGWYQLFFFEFKAIGRKWKTCVSPFLSGPSPGLNHWTIRWFVWENFSLNYEPVSGVSSEDRMYGTGGRTYHSWRKALPRPWKSKILKMAWANIFDSLLTLTWEDIRWESGFSVFCFQPHLGWIIYALQEASFDNSRFLF